MEFSKFSNTITTTVTPFKTTGEIEIFTESCSMGVKEKLTCEIIRTKEALVRKALIDLGWTPPKEEA